MKALLGQIAEWLAAGKSVAVARVVELMGSGVLPAGAALAVTADEVLGSASGGCVEGALVAEARKALGQGAGSSLLSFGCSDEEGFAVGLSCGGVVRVLLECLTPPAAGWLVQLEKLVNASVGAALVDVIDRSGRQIGAKTVVAEDDPVPQQGFAVADEDVRRVVLREVLADLRGERSAMHSYPVVNEAGECETTVFVDSFPAPPRLVIVGAASFSAALTAQAKLLGYRVAVCDPRPVFASTVRHPLADEVAVEWPDRYLNRIGGTLGERDAICVLSHDSKFDYPAVTASLGTRAGYIGLMGSRRTQSTRRLRLLTAGIDEGQIARLRGPVGLDLGARTPEETAVSIVAEMIAVRRGGGGGPLTFAEGAIHAQRSTGRAAATL